MGTASFRGVEVRGAHFGPAAVSRAGGGPVRSAPNAEGDDGGIDVVKLPDRRIRLRGYRRRLTAAHLWVRVLSGLADFSATGMLGQRTKLSHCT